MTFTPIESQTPSTNDPNHKHKTPKTRFLKSFATRRPNQSEKENYNTAFINLLATQ